VRTVRTASGVMAVQVVWSSRWGSRQNEHLGSAHDAGELAALNAVATERIAAGQTQLDLGLDTGAPAGPLEVVGSKAGHLWDALCRAYESLGFVKATGGDEVFHALVLARIIEPTSKLDSLRVLAEAGVDAPSYATLKRRLPAMGNRCGARTFLLRALPTLLSGRPAWCSTTCPRSPSKPMLVTGSVSPGSPRNAASNHRSPSGC
jgi:hypothetical protein